MKITNFCLFWLGALLFSGGPAAMAQESPLAGGVQMSVDTAPTRIDRNTLRRTPVSGAIEASANNTIQTGVNATEFRPAPQAQTASSAPLLDSKLFEGLVNKVLSSPPLRANATASDTTAKQPPSSSAPYIWSQSAYGGYFDASGTTKELVRANRLHLFGGKFADGTPVPKTQIRDYNAMGHAYRDQRLNTAHFWNH